MSNSSKTRGPAKKGRYQTTSVTADPMRHADDFHVPTYRPKPAQVPQITSRHSTTAIYPDSGGETSTRACMNPPQESGPPEVESEVGIIVMGATGSGKSTFINLVSGSSLGVSRELRSCTNTVQMAAAFNLDGRRVVLIDTPGFDDTTQSDTDVLRTIAAFLEASYERDLMLAGVLYFHRISDLRMGGAQTRNFRMFRSLCGESALGNVVIVTNMWSGVEPEVGDAREAELMGEDIFFKPVLEKGARMARHEDTVPSAEAVIRLLVNNQPLPLQIQTELVKERKDIVETSAGQELNQELNVQIRKHQEDIRIITEEMEQAEKDQDEETRNELESETRRMHEEIRRFENEAKRLASDYRREKSEFDSRLAEMERLRRRGNHGAEYRQHASRWGGNYLRPSSATSYRPTPAPTPTTEEQFTTAPGRFGKTSSSRDSRDKPGIMKTARAYMSGGFGSFSKSSPYQ